MSSQKTRHQKLNSYWVMNSLECGGIAFLTFLLCIIDVDGINNLIGKFQK